MTDRQDGSEMKDMNKENNRVLVVDDQHEIHDDFAEMLKPVLVRPSTDDLAAAFVGDEEEERFLPEFELLHASNGEEAYEIIPGREGSRTAPSPWPTSISECLRASTASRRSAG